MSGKRPTWRTSGLRHLEDLEVVHFEPRRKARTVCFAHHAPANGYLAPLQAPQLGSMVADELISPRVGLQHQKHVRRRTRNDHTSGRRDSLAPQFTSRVARRSWLPICPTLSGVHYPIVGRALCRRRKRFPAQHEEVGARQRESAAPDGFAKPARRKRFPAPARSWAFSMSCRWVLLSPPSSSTAVPSSARR